MSSALTLLTCVAESGTPQAVSDQAEQTRLGKATASRIAAELASCGVLIRSGRTGTYTLGARALVSPVPRHRTWARSKSRSVSSDHSGRDRLPGRRARIGGRKPVPPRRADADHFRAAKGGQGGAADLRTRRPALIDRCLTGAHLELTRQPTTPR
ncbi:helix-turn-helix domain-containing protein [Streptomyces niveus]|uniref:helix-turn-helix domain-containing protein n=1 Tax=Streptomyces niveus TaxID=193462 RepID=UPI0037154307